MAYRESIIDEHLRRIAIDDYEYGTVTDQRLKALHLVSTVIAQIHSGVQLALASEEDFDTIYGERTIGNKESWLLLQTLLKKLADEHTIQLKNEDSLIGTITTYFK
jgi:hypothetical protein